MAGLVLNVIMLVTFLVAVGPGLVAADGEPAGPDPGSGCRPGCLLPIGPDPGSPCLPACPPDVELAP